MMQEYVRGSVFFSLQELEGFYAESDVGGAGLGRTAVTVGEKQPEAG